MELSLTTPSLLFPTVSVLLLAYTNRFIAIGNRIRNLHAEYHKDQGKSTLQQIKIMRLRIRLIRDLQIISITSLFLSALTMFLIFEGQIIYAKYTFGASLVLLMIAFSMACIEIILSTKALFVQIKDLEDLI